MNITNIAASTYKGVANCTALTSACGGRTFTTVIDLTGRAYSIVEVESTHAACADIGRCAFRTVGNVTYITDKIVDEIANTAYATLCRGGAEDTVTYVALIADTATSGIGVWSIPRNTTTADIISSTDLAIGHIAIIAGQTIRRKIITIITLNTDIVKKAGATKKYPATGTSIIGVYV